MNNPEEMIPNEAERIAEMQRETRRLWRRGRAKHSFGTLLRFLGMMLLALLLGLHAMFTGPSQTVRDMLTMSLLESSALKFVPYMYMSGEEVAGIIDECSLHESEEKTDTSLIVIEPAEEEREEEAAEEPIALYPVSGSTYKGYVMIVKDPSRVFLGVINEQFNTAGVTIDKLVEKYGAVGGINASGFMDEGGMGNGGTPKGMVISEGKLLRNDESVVIAAFDNDNILHVGKYTAADAAELGFRDAAGWGPALIVNGEPADLGNTSTTGLNPRTGIGQRSDGAIIMVVLDGRHASSLGGTYADLIEIFMRYGAVNACNLDGGYSSIMYYDGDRVSDVTGMDRSRRIPTAFLIRGEEE